MCNMIKYKMKIWFFHFLSHNTRRFFFQFWLWSGGGGQDHPGGGELKKYKKCKKHPEKQQKAQENIKNQVRFYEALQGLG